MTMTTAFTRQNKGTWREAKTSPGVATAFTISWDQFELMLADGKPPANWQLRQWERVVRFETGPHGVKVFIASD